MRCLVKEFEKESKEIKKVKESKHCI